jgi:hypothetical protein
MRLKQLVSSLMESGRLYCNIGAAINKHYNC